MAPIEDTIDFLYRTNSGRQFGYCLKILFIYIYIYIYIYIVKLKMVPKSMTRIQSTKNKIFNILVQYENRWMAS
jgi:hypothetical protein